MPPLDTAIKPTKPAEIKDGQLSALHHEIFMTEEQMHIAEACAASALAAVYVGMCVARVGSLRAVDKALKPLLEEALVGLQANALRMTKAAPKTNFHQLKNGLELTFDREVNVFGTKTDLVSVMHPTLGEAHLLKDGSRIVMRPGVGNFYDEAGKSIHMAFPSLERPTVSFENKNLTANNKKMFRTIENTFLTGNAKHIDASGLFERVTKY